MDQGSEHNAGDVAQGSCLFYGGHPHKISAQESSLGSLITSNEGLVLERGQYVKETEQARCSLLYDGGLNNTMESRGLFISQEASKRLKMASESQQQQEQLLLSGPRFPYGVIEGSNNININNNNNSNINNARSSVERCCNNNNLNVRSSLVVDSSISKEDSIFQRAHISALTTNPLLNIASTCCNNIPIALPLLSSSCKNDPPLLQDLPWFANHALEEEELGGGLAGFPLVRPINYANPSDTSSFSAHARSSLISLLGETEHAEQCILQAHIVAHPLFEQLLAAHLACLRIGTPPEHWPADAQSLDARLTLSRQELDAKYLLLARNAPPPHDKDNLDHFMLSFTLLLQTFREQLREHMQVHSAEASSGCAEIKDAFFRLSGETSIGAGGASSSTMSEDEEMVDEEGEIGSLHHHDPTNAPMCSPFNSNMMAGEIDKSLMESVRRELKLELKQNYRSKLWDVREEIMRKRRAGKLPGSTTSLLKDWWDAHSKWPYPTEEEKMKLVQETGLELKQINNWFINQRKRNWNTNPAYARADIDEFSLYGTLHPAC